MIKVMWFLKRAKHLSLAEFGTWWTSQHAPDIVADQTPHLKKYLIDLRVEDDANLAGKPEEDTPWDGIAEQFFATEADYNAVYGRTERPTRADTLRHTSKFQRMVVREIEVNVTRARDSS